ncbi:hypothetical protein O3P69_014886 [Scylla paramamosain]|uniref:Uncharacterized protein n=1 Tax=Scylla paramamosain TaxID=85552 RepID=A0AAW0U1F4_SCYPA
MHESHINLRELWVAKEWPLGHPHIRNTAIRFDMDNMAAVQCIARQGEVVSAPQINGGDLCTRFQEEHPPVSEALQGLVPQLATPGVSLPSGQGHLPTPFVTEVTRLEFLKVGLAGRFPPSAVQTMLKAHQPSSIKQYESCWRRF